VLYCKPVTLEIGAVNDPLKDKAEVAPEPTSVIPVILALVLLLDKSTQDVPLPGYDLVFAASKCKNKLS
jgi:hypothetical protein